MINLNNRDILVHEQFVPWPNKRQVEQDLLLCQAMTALFSDPFLKTQIAMRGGTLLHKVHLDPAARYSEDIDLVVIGDSSEIDIINAINRVLNDVLGKPSDSRWDNVKLAIRNTFKSSRIFRMTFEVKSISNGPKLKIIVEANVTERDSHRGISVLNFNHQFRDQDHSVQINGFEINEMLGTKMRALFQRCRGRDLFDLYWALKKQENSDIGLIPAEIINSFEYYMKKEGSSSGRDEFIAALNNHLKNPGFLTDMNPLIRTGITYDPLHAGEYVISNLLNLLPDQISNKPTKTGLLDKK